MLVEATDYARRLGVTVPRRQDGTATTVHDIRRAIGACRLWTTAAPAADGA